MGAVTTFITKNTRHSTPVIMAAAIFIGSSYLNTYDEAMDKLDMIQSPTAWQRKKPLVRSLISAFATWGALMNQSIANRRKKLESDDENQPPVQPPIGR